MQIYNFVNRLFMIIETEDDFSFERNKRIVIIVCIKWEK